MKKKSKTGPISAIAICAMMLLAVGSLWAAGPTVENNALSGWDAGADQRMRRVVKILRTTDKSQVNQYVPVAFEMQNVNPYAVLRFVRRVIEVEEGNWWTYVAPDGNRGRLVVNVPIWQVQPMQELVVLLDRPGLTSSDNSKRVYMYLKHRDPSDPGFVDVVGQLMADTGTIVSHPQTGALYLQDSPSGVDRVLSYIENDFDAPTRQTMLRAKIYEVDLTNDGTVGLDFHAWKNGPGRNLFALGAFEEYVKTSRVGINGTEAGGASVFHSGVDAYGLPNRRHSAGGYHAAYFYDVPSAYFDYLVAKGRARVLTAPRATVLNTETAYFATGEEILYYQVQNGETPWAGVRPSDMPLDPLGGAEPYDDDHTHRVYPDNRTVTGQTISRAVYGIAKAGVELLVTPTIGEQSIDLDLDISIVSQLGYDSNGLPTLHTREVDTRIRATPGREYIIGGMTRTRAIQTTRKVPVLGSIPIIGYLFGGEITTAKKTLLAMVISADTVDDTSGLSPVESKTIDAVNETGMDAVEVPQTLAGFEMMGSR